MGAGVHSDAALRGRQRAGGGGRHPRPAQPVGARVAAPACGAGWAPTCDGQGGASGLGHAAAGVLSRVLPAQAPQHQLCHVAPLPRLPAPIGLHLQAPLTPDDGGSRLGKLTLQAGRGTLLSLQALQRLPEHHLWGCGAGIGVKGRGKASPKPEAQSPRQETGTPNPVRPTEGLGQACLTCPQDPLPQAPLEDRSGSGVTGGVYSKGEEGLQWGPQKGPWI